jgi:hypothetical protein
MGQFFVIEQESVGPVNQLQRDLQGFSCLIEQVGEV